MTSSDTSGTYSSMASRIQSATPSTIGVYLTGALGPSPKSLSMIFPVPGTMSHLWAEASAATRRTTARSPSPSQKSSRQDEPRDEEECAHAGEPIERWRLEQDTIL